jgi:predicted RNA-binding Zn ribbon-like protein
MPDPVDDEILLLDLLNSTPVVDRAQRDLLATASGGRAWAHTRGGTGSPAEASHLREVRDRLQAVVRGMEPAAVLGPLLAGIRLRPEIAAGGLGWQLDAGRDRRLSARALLAWGRVEEQMPGRLRACANDECRLFLLDRSRPNTARWCSMQACGNRLKSRRHYRRTRGQD